jgi:Tol biopolymer transport system component
MELSNSLEKIAEQAPETQTSDADSPDGRWLVYVQMRDDERKDLYLKARDGSAQHTVQEAVSVSRVSWSPDSRWLAYYGQDSNQQPYLTIIEAPEAPNSPLQRFVFNPAIEFMRWSSDSRFLFSISINAERFLVWSAADQKLYDLPLVGELRTFWQIDPDSERFAYVTQHLDKYYLHIGTPQGTQVVYEAKDEFYSLHWAPKGGHLAFFTISFLLGVVDPNLNVYEVGRAVTSNREFASSKPVVWAADGQSLYYLQPTEKGDALTNWMSYSIVEKRATVIIPNSADFPSLNTPYFSPTNRQQIIIAWWIERRTSRKAALMNLDDRRYVLLLEYADEFDDPYWSPDGKYAAVVWATKRNGAVHLTWANAETLTAQTLSDTQWNIRDLRWLGGSTGLFFVIERRSAAGETTYSAEYIVPATGVQRTLATQEQIGSVLPQEDVLQFWWRTGKTFGVVRYAPNGDLIFQYSAEDDGSTPLIARVSRWENRWLPRDPLPNVFPAPTGGHGALVVNRQKVYLVYPEGRWHLLRDNLVYARSLVWSSDGMRLAFAQKIGTTMTIEVVTADGTLVQNIDLSADAESLRWTRCGSSE